MREPQEYQDWATDDRLMRLRYPGRNCPLRAFGTLSPWRYAVGLIIASLIAFRLGYVPAPLPDIRTPVTVAAIPGAAITDPIEATILMDSDILAGVAIAEDPNAMAGVQWVMLNRAGCEFLEDSFYACDRSLLEVATEGQAFGTVIRGVYHRSWWPGRVWHGAARRAQLAEAEGVAVAVLSGFVPDPTEGATHYHRMGTWTPPWAPERRAWRILGSHAFYQEHFPPRRSRGL